MYQWYMVCPSDFRCAAAASSRGALGQHVLHGLVRQAAELSRVKHQLCQLGKCSEDCKPICLLCIAAIAMIHVHIGL